MNLGDLEFCPGDFEGEFGYHNENADRACRIANKLLRKRLESAPTSQCYWPPWLDGFEIDAYLASGEFERVWKFRMVCGEEILLSHDRFEPGTCP